MAAPGLATLPMALSMLSMLLCSFPISYAMQRYGRKAFLLGVIAQILAAVGFILAIVKNNDRWLLAASLLLGYIANANFYRFAVLEMVAKEQQSRALAKFMFVGVLAALIAPNLAIHTQTLWQPVFTATIFSFIPLSLLALLLLYFCHLHVYSQQGSNNQFLNSTKPLESESQSSRWQIAQPVIAATIAYAVMVLVMSATPLHMSAHSHHFSDIAWVIQWHVLGMFAPSLLFSWLVRHLGLQALMVVGAVCLLAALLMNFAAHNVWHYTLALCVLGVGWNFVFVGSSQWLMTFINNNNKAFVQALNEVCVFAFAALATFSSAWLLVELNWQILNLLLMAPVLLLCGLLGLSYLKARS